MSFFSIFNHAALVAVLLSGWLLYEALNNNQRTIELVLLQSRIESMRLELDTIRGRVQIMDARLDEVDRLANSVGPAILRDLITISSEKRNPAITALLDKHGISAPRGTTGDSSSPDKGSPSH
jgi:hypothetical protein